MNFNKIKNIIPAATLLLTMGLASCDYLDVTPLDPNSVSEVDETALYAKCYANMALAGNTGADGECDIDGLDGGTTGFVRQMWNANELTTDEAICAWGDTGIPAFNYNTYDASHPMLQGFYYRLYVGIDYCNQYLDVCKDVNAQRTAEVRFLRCLYYYYLLDCFGNVPFALELSATSPEQIKRADLFNWIEAELLGKAVTFNTYSKGVPGNSVTREAGNAIIEGLQSPAARKSTDAGYGTADQDAANLLLARLYLNAEVYTGSARWADAKTYAEKVINGPHKLFTSGITDNTGLNWSAYQMLFMGDNGENGASVEAILPLVQDGTTTTSWGTTLFLMASTWKADMNEDGTYGTSEFWAGNRARSQFIAKFFPNGDAPNASIRAMAKAASDDRALFCGIDRSLTVEKPTEYTSGYGVGKYRNTYTTCHQETAKNDTVVNGKEVKKGEMYWERDKSHNSQFVDTDYFLMRSAEAYLIAAECDARLNGNKVTATGKQYIDAIRSRSYAAVRAAYSLNDILDERARELYYEGFRRTDLVRFGLYGGDKSNTYLWDWKGGSATGAGFPATRNIFALPAEDVNANPNLEQNPGY